MEPKIILLTLEDKENLRKKFENLPEITTFETEIKLASEIASYGIYREVGTVNDELARFIFDGETQNPIRLDSLKCDLVQWMGLRGVRVYSEDSQKLELRSRGFYDVVHPRLSSNEDGTLHSLYIFPEIISKIAQKEGIELVLVKSWCLNSIFGGFDPSKGYYQTNFWEIENNDALKFSELIGNCKIAFLGTHDLIAHIAGLDQTHWPLLKKSAQRVYDAIATYFKSTSAPSISSLILPYTLGVILDDLAQPPSYSSKSHLAVLERLLKRISKNEIPTHIPTLLTEFPKTFQNLIILSRTKNIELHIDQIDEAINIFIQEILQSCITHPV